MPLQIQHRETEDGVVIVSIAGKVMLGRESGLLETLVPGLIAQGRRTFIFEMSGVSQIDSTGIGRFITAYNQITKAGGRLLIACSAGHVRDAFHVTRLDSVFKFYDNVETAQAAI